MIVRIIGGHGGVGQKARATSYLIDGKILIDAGSVAEGLTLEEQLGLSAIFISHAHLDHVKDLAFLADNCFGQRPTPFSIYATSRVRQMIKKHILNDQIWPDFTKLPSIHHPTLSFHPLKLLVPLQIDDYSILPVKVNHPGPGTGFIVEKGDVACVFTQDTGPTEEIWQEAHKFHKKIKAIFTEISFPNAMQHVATVSKHHTPHTLSEEIMKMPKEVPLFIGHLKPTYQTTLCAEIAALNNPRLIVMETDDQSYVINDR